MALGAVVPRVSMAFALLPLFGRSSTTGAMRGAIGVALSLPLVPLAHAQLGSLPGDFDQLPFVLLVMREVILGAVLGWVMAFPFWAAEASGFIIDNQRGMGMAGIFNPQSQSDSSPLGIFFQQAFTCMFLLAGGFGFIITAVYNSYLVWPISTAWPHLTVDTALAALRLFDSLLAAAIVLAAPPMLTMLLLEIALAIANVVTPQMPVLNISMGLKTSAALLVMLLYIHLLMGHHFPALIPGFAAGVDVLRGIRP